MIPTLEARLRIMQQLLIELEKNSDIKKLNIIQQQADEMLKTIEKLWKTIR